MKQFIQAIIITSSLVLMSCTSPQAKETTKNSDMTDLNNEEKNFSGSDTVTFGAGCFWCVEAIFQQLNGVQHVASGYMGGKRENPTYEQVCSGATGHAEVIQVSYDPSVITFTELLEVFWGVHDPTTLNRQGADVGTQYRSVIFYHTEEQHQLADNFKKKLNESGAFHGPIVTEISPAGPFYKAENYHQNYYNENSGQPYCTLVIRPKLEKFHKVFATKVKK